MNRQHRRKLIAPIVIVLLIVAYYIGFAVLCAAMPGFPLWARFACGLAPLALAGVAVMMLVERIREIRSGEEDDLSQY